MVDISNPRRQRHLSGHVQRIHLGRGALAGLRLGATGVAHCGGELRNTAAGDQHLADEVAHAAVSAEVSVATASA